MEDSTLIWKFLTREYPDEHVVLYLYCCGNLNSPNTAINRVMKTINKVFCPPINESIAKTVVIAYLDYKKKQYLKGEIKVKPIY